jgi:hypothetical protein
MPVINRRRLVLLSSWIAVVAVGLSPMRLLAASKSEKNAPRCSDVGVTEGIAATALPCEPTRGALSAD